ncbi:MAG: hypothetical protein ACRDYE_11780 [Acidimicrobiales bacterium]
MARARARARARAAFARAGFAQALRSLLRPEGLPPEAAAELEAAFGGIGREVVGGGPGRMGRVRAEVRAAPPRLLDWMSSQVLEHPAVLYDREGVELLASRQARSISTAVGALQVALVGAAAVSTFEGGPVLALAIDGVVGQVASIVHGFCDWYNTSSYLVRKLNDSSVRVDPNEVRRLTNAALMSKGRVLDERALARSTELRLFRGWVARGVVDALPFGSSLGRASVRATGRIDQSDLAGLVGLLRADDPGGRGIHQR